MSEEPDLPGTYHASPQTIAESVSQLVARGYRFTACICGPRGAGKTTALAAILRAYPNELNEIAAFAPWPAIQRLRVLAGDRWPACPELSGSPLATMRRHSAVARSNRNVHLDAVATDYLDDVIAPLNDISDDRTSTELRFLESLKPRLLAALSADQESRLDDLPLPRNAYLEAVRDYAANYKRRRRLLDIADLVHGDYYVSRRVRLLILDEVEPDEAKILPRYFPSAAVIIASQQPSDTDLTMRLSHCLRKPERIDLPAGPASTVPPPPDDFGSLFILVPPWRRSAWLTWLRHHGLPAPFRLNRWPADHAAAVLARYDRLTRLPVVRLGNPASVRGIEAETVIAELEACCNSEMFDLALTRATRRLVVIGRP